MLGGVRIHRVHLEEDAAKLVHVGASGRIHGSDRSVVDFNRGGTPLVEIVTEPDIHSPEQAREWLTLLRTTLKQIGVSDVNMEEGSLRCDANVSVRPVGSSELGTKTELKNMNSFRFLERGLRAEIDRQVKLLAAGEPVVQETLHFDPVSARLSPLRSKEEAHDYRYFPEPDLVPLVATDAMIGRARKDLPHELPAERAKRFERELGLSAETARLFAFRAELGDYFEQALAAAGDAGTSADGVNAVELSNWIPQLIERLGSDIDPARSKVSPESFATLVKMVKTREVSRDAAREVLSKLVEEGGEPREVVAREGLGALSATEDGLGEVVDRAIGSDPAAAEQVRTGNAKAIGPLVAYVMRETKGRADGGEVTRLIRERLRSAE
jgi:aspartyl-tRNA(Asn)/glutamyl-tRNA(Gln) amidotransferase subunit B